MSITSTDLEMLTEVIFQGFVLVLGWHQSLLNNKETWGLEMATYWIIFVFLLLFGGSGWALGKRAFKHRHLNAAEVLDGSTPMDEPPEEVGSRLGRILTAILDSV